MVSGRSPFSSSSLSRSQNLTPWPHSRHDDRRRHLGHGHLLPCGTCVKKAIPKWTREEFYLRHQAQQLRKEIAIYKHRPEVHHRLLHMYESTDDRKVNVSLMLDYLPNNTLYEHLRGFTFQEYQNAKALPSEKHTDTENRLRSRHDSIPLRQRAHWALAATDGVAVLHAHDVINADIKPGDMGLGAQLDERLFDIAGSSLPDQPPLCADSRRYYMPRSSWRCTTRQRTSLPWARESTTL